MCLIFFFFSIISNRTAGQKVKLLHSGGKVLNIESLQMSEDKLGEMSIFFSVRFPILISKIL